jgi:hypothetical protein
MHYHCQDELISTQFSYEFVASFSIYKFEKERISEQLNLFAPMIHSFQMATKPF